MYWYQNDHLGTPHCLTDAHGEAVRCGKAITSPSAA
ncbi:hypothetical protein G4V03_03205 [Escherichia coli]|nr:hypothetical protein [Escherichia coli]